MSLSDAEKRMVGGSDVAAIAGVSPYGSAFSVWDRIVNGTGREDTPALSRGRRLEPVVLDWYAEQTGRLLVRNVRWSTGMPHLRASLDAVAREADGAAWDRVVDAKTAGANEAHRYGDEGTDQIPLEYLCQFQFYMGLTGRVQTDVPALVAGDFRLYHVAYDADVYGALREVVDRFWVDHVLTKRPPDPTTLPNDMEAIRRRFRRHEGETPLDFVALPPETQVTLEEYLRAYAEESVAADRRELWEARAKLALGSAPGVRGLPEALGFHRLDWKAQAGKTAWKRVAEELARRLSLTPAQLSALAAENTGEGSRPFTPHRKRGT
jgi:putative phage-type endonuclease